MTMEEMHINDNICTFLKEVDGATAHVFAAGIKKELKLVQDNADLVSMESDPPACVLRDTRGHNNYRDLAISQNMLCFDTKFY